MHARPSGSREQCSQEQPLCSEAIPLIHHHHPASADPISLTIRPSTHLRAASYMASYVPPLPHMPSSLSCAHATEPSRRVRIGATRAYRPRAPSDRLLRCSARERPLAVRRALPASLSIAKHPEALPAPKGSRLRPLAAPSDIVAHHTPFAPSRARRRGQPPQLQPASAASPLAHTYPPAA